jgi:hypothetical protein
LDDGAVEFDLSFGRLIDSGDHVEERRLAGAVRSDQSLDGASWNNKIDAVNRGQTSKAFCHA